MHISYDRNYKYKNKNWNVIYIWYKAAGTIQLLAIQKMDNMMYTCNHCGYTLKIIIEKRIKKVYGSYKTAFGDKLSSIVELKTPNVYISKGCSGNIVGCCGTIH